MGGGGVPGESDVDYCPRFSVFGEAALISATPCRRFSGARFHRIGDRTGKDLRDHMFCTPPVTQRSGRAWCIQASYEGPDDGGDTVARTAEGGASAGRSVGRDRRCGVRDYAARSCEAR